MQLNGDACQLVEHSHIAVKEGTKRKLRSRKSNKLNYFENNLLCFFYSYTLIGLLNIYYCTVMGS